MKHDVVEKPRYMYKRTSIAYLEDDPDEEFSQIPNNVIIVENVQSYIHLKFETLGDFDISKEFTRFTNKI